MMHRRQTNMRRGAAMLLCSSFCIALSSGLIHLGGDLPALEKQFIRSATMILLSCGTLIGNTHELQVRRVYVVPLILRGLFGAIAASCNFYSIDHLPLATANMLAKLAPFFTVIFAWVFLHEKLRPINVIALVTAFAGVFLAVQPRGGEDLDLFAVAMGFSSGFFGGAAFASLRACDRRGAPNAVTVLSFSLGSLLFSIPTMIWGYVPVSLPQVLIIVSSGLVATVGHFCIAMAYRYAPPSRISVFDYCQIVWSAIIGLLLFGQVPNAWSIAGYAVIILTGVMVFMADGKAGTTHS